MQCRIEPSLLSFFPTGVVIPLPDEYIVFTQLKLSSLFSLYRSSMGKGMPRAHTAVESSMVPASHSTPPVTQAVAELTGASGSQNSPSLYSPSLPQPPIITVATNSLIPQTTHSRLCASLLETHIVCCSILEG